MWLRKKSDNILSLEDASELDFIDRKALSPLEKLEREETRQFIRKAIDSLSERNRLAVTLFYMDGLSYKDIGDFLGVPVNTVKSRLHEARKHLKEEFLKVVRTNFEEHKLPQDFADKVLHEVSVLSIAKDPRSQIPIVFLANKEDDLQRLPIWIGIPESEAIERVLQGEETPRPMTHDLIANILRECGIKLTAAVVSEIKETTFYSKLILDSNGEVKTVDSRPSDAIAIALRMDAPIFVEQSVLNRSGIWLPPIEIGKHPEEFSKRVIEFAEKGQYNEVVEIYLAEIQRLAKSKENAEMIALLNWEMAELYHNKMSMYDDAIKHYEQALKHFEGEDRKAHIYHRMAWNYANREMHAEAIPAFKKVLEIWPSNIDALFGLGKSYARKDLWDEAIVQFQKVLQVDERHTEARSWIADRYFITGNYEQAKEEFEKCVNFNKGPGYARMRLADICEKLGEYDEALETLKEAVSTCDFEREGTFTVYALEKLEKLYQQLDRRDEFVGYCRDTIAEILNAADKLAKERGTKISPEDIERIESRNITKAAQMDWWLGEYFSRKGDSEAAKAQYEKLGLIQEEDWHIIGPFDNVENSGISTEYPPESEIDFDKSYQGMSSEVHWQKAQGGRSKSCVDFAAIFGIKEWAVSYALTTINSPEETDAQLRIGSKDSAVVWLNGEQIHKNIMIPRIGLPDQAVIPVKLKKGDNRLLIKSCVGKQMPGVPGAGEAPAGWELSTEWCIFARVA